MITIQDLSFGYRKRRPVLDRLTLDLNAGAVCGVLGPNGVGKTTFLHLLGGLLFPQSGRLEVGGRIPARRQADFLERVFYVPVAFDLPAMRVSGYAERYAAFYPHFDREAWKHALHVFGIQPADKTNALSFGQKKKVLLSFALSSGCDLLLLDEPTDGLDIVSKDGFRRLLARHAGEQRLVVIATHHVQDIAMLLDRLIILQHHGLLLDAPIDGLAGSFRSVITAQAPEAGLTVFSERVPGGFHALVRNTDGHEGPLDLELFYKALQAHPELAQQYARYEKHV